MATLFFDLDGTLIDSAIGITRCVAYALEQLDQPVPPEEELRRWIGPALRVSFLPLLKDADRVEQAVEHYLERFESHGWLEHEPYEGIGEVVEALHAAGHRLAVVTAKNEPHARRILAHLPFGGRFVEIVGSTRDGRLTHKPELIAEALRRLQPADRPLMIGDRHMDIDGARAHGLDSVGVLWGFGSEEELRGAGATRLARTPAQLLAAVHTFAGANPSGLHAKLRAHGGVPMSDSLRRTKILATLGPATDKPGVLEDILAAGVNVVRMNFSHGTAESHAARVGAVREAAARLGREVAILGDLQGPKIRIEKFAAGKVALKAGDRFVLEARADAAPGDATRVGVSYLGLVNDLVAGDTVLLDDGLMAVRVDRIEGDLIHTTVLTDGFLSDRKGLNRLGGGLSLGALTDKDRADIKLAARLEVEFLAVSFCRSGADMEEARRLAREAGSDAHLVAKIERAEAIDNLGEIIDASDAVMVARGDLGVEIGDAELPGLQKKIIRESLARGRVVITATQMLQSMVDSPIPTRAEVLDVANAVIDGTDAVMLSQETAAGNYPARAVEAMARICLGAERQFEPDTDFEKAQRGLERSDQAIAMASMFLAEHIQVRAILAMTESGGTARFLSRFRSRVPIYGLSRYAPSRRRMAMMRDVFPVDFDSRGKSPRHAAREAISQLFALGCLAEGDRVIVTSGDHMEHHGATNTLRMLQVGPDGTTEGLGEL